MRFPDFIYLSFFMWMFGYGRREEYVYPNGTLVITTIGLGLLILVWESRIEDQE